jgi:predicted RNA binding protein YcfA (HicA-like mRNA interferase family)
MKVSELVDRLKQDGWLMVRLRGSHRQYRHPVKPGTVTVSGKSSADVPIGTLKSALKQAGLLRKD